MIPCRGSTGSATACGGRPRAAPLRMLLHAAAAEACLLHGDTGAVMWIVSVSQRLCQLCLVVLCLLHGPAAPASMHHRLPTPHACAPRPDLSTQVLVAVVKRSGGMQGSASSACSGATLTMAKCMRPCNAGGPQRSCQHSSAPRLPPMHQLLEPLRPPHAGRRPPGLGPTSCA